MTGPEVDEGRRTGRGRQGDEVDPVAEGRSAQGEMEEVGEGEAGLGRYV